MDADPLRPPVCADGRGGEWSGEASEFFLREVRKCMSVDLPDGGCGGLVAVGAPREVITPAHLEVAYGIAASVEDGPNGAPFVVRHL